MPLLPTERAFFDALRVAFPDADLWRNRHDGALYARLTGDHASHTGRQDVWIPGRTLYVNLETRLTYDRESGRGALGFEQRFEPVSEEG
jgi:hypothetical protein